MANRELLLYAYAEAKKSGDKSTHIGAILTNESGFIVARGHNDIPTPCCDKPERRVAPLKYPWVCHGEVWAILDAAKRGIPTEGLTMVATWAACPECAKCLIMAGIKKLVRHVIPIQQTNTKWLEGIVIADQMFKEAGVEVVDFTEQLFTTVLFNGKEIDV